MKNNNQKITVPQSFNDDFKSRCETMPNGCISYLGAHTVRIPSGVATDARFVSPRRAAYLIDKKQMPTREIKLVCHTPTCVNPEHFIEGRLRNTDLTVIDSKLIKKIKSEKSSQREIAKKYKLSRNTVAKLLRRENSLI
jgi:hypothetical protein